MATAKRERQKALRAQKLEQQQKVTKRKQTGKKTLTAAVVVVMPLVADWVPLGRVKSI